MCGSYSKKELKNSVAGLRIFKCWRFELRTSAKDLS